MTAQQLKNSILQMAVQGKLVPQDPNDEPASVLLQRIKAEKQELIKAGKIKKDKKSSEIFRGATHNLPYAYCEQIGKEIRDISDEIPFEIPDSWEWVRLSYLGEIVGGGTPKTGETCYWKNGDIPWLTPADMKYVKGKYVSSGERFITEKGLNESSAQLMPMGTVLYSSRAPIGYIAIAENNICTNQGFKSLVPFLKEINLYAYYCVIAFTPDIQSRASGTTFKEISGAEFGRTIIPLPPLSEQHRIVAKIEELLPYIERYGKAEEHLTTLNTTFPEALKKSILQEAVQGKLVPQNPDDEPASVLLERIRAEKQELIKQGKIKKNKNESVIITRDKIPYEIIDGKERCIADEVPFELPEGWCWCRFGTAMVNRDAERIPLSVSEREKLDKTYDYYGASGVIDKVDRFLFDKPLLLIGEDGANLLLRSKPIAFIAKGQYWVNNHAHVLDTVGGLSMKYICVYINAINLSPYVTGTAQPKMNQEKMNSILVPIPPIEEQHRIVAKIEEIMPMIERLTQR